MERLGTLLLCVCVLALAGGIALELRSGPKSNSPMQDARSAGKTAAAATASVQSVPDGKSWLGTTLARPLFSATRRPSSVIPVDQAAATSAKLPRLAGIMIDGPRRSVIFAPAGDKKPIVVAEGGFLDGFRVDHVKAGTVTVSGPGGHETLRTSFDPNAPAPPPINPLVIPVPPLSQASFNGPPGLDRMPPLVTAGTGAVASSVAGPSGQPNIGNLVGIPGLTQPKR